MVDGDSALESEEPVEENDAALRHGPLGFEEHPERNGVLGELHARPLLPIEVPRVIYHFAFMTDEAAAVQDRVRVAEMAKARGLPTPDAHGKYHRFDLGRWELRWEQHTEFTTYTWSTALEDDAPFPRGNPMKDGEVKFIAPGPLIVATSMSILERAKLMARVSDFFQPQSLCVINASNGQAQIATDFVVDTSGFTRFLIETRSMSEIRAGRLTQRILEIETYRTLALLGLPVARKVSPDLTRMERELSRITGLIAAAKDHHESQDLLHKLGGLAAEIEAQSAKTAFRFGATRAYFNLVKSRVALIDEQPLGDYVSITAFFDRRLVPAIETCNAVETRQSRLSLQIARTADLLRTGIQFDLEQQNRDLLQSMDRRAKMQLRLQQTVEGLSVAAISYYVVGLITYLAKGLADVVTLPVWFSPTVITAVSVPMVIGGVWYLMHRVKRSFIESDAKMSKDAKS